MQRLLMIGMNHATAPLAIREKFAFSPAQREQALQRFREAFPAAEAVLVSTCNRVELYTARAVHAHPRLEEMISFISQFHGLADTEFRPHLYDKANRDVADHLFMVAASLDSLVVGETQILGQVRESYDVACRVGTVNTLLHPLFQRAIATAKEVMSATHLAEGRRSVASIAVEYARQIFETFADKTVLSIGAGKMSALVLQHLSDLHIKRLIVCNRDIEKAKVLSQRFGGAPVAMDGLQQHLAEADIVVSSTASPTPIITRELFKQVMKQRRWKPAFLMDIALPRDIEQAVGELDNVYLYNIDDLQQVAAATDSCRRESVDSARQIVVQRVEEFITSSRARELGPLIERLFERSHAIAREEVQRAVNKLPDITEEERQHLDDLARRIVNKLLNDPVQTVRNGGSANGSDAYVHALAKLFRLE